MTSVNQIKGWFYEGVKDGATHMIVKWDMFDGPEGDYPIYAYPGQNPADVAAKNGDRTVEVYAMHLPFDSQAKEYRSFHWESA